MIVHAVFANFSLRYPLALHKQGIALEDNKLYEPGLLRTYEVSLDLDNVRNQVQSDNPGEKLVSNDLDWIGLELINFNIQRLDWDCSVTKSYVNQAGTAGIC